MKAWRGFGAPVRDDINDLDCAECGGWFHSFGALAEHMKKDHVMKPHRPHSSRSLCGTCTRDTGPPRKDQTTMAPRSKKNTGRVKDAGRATTGNLPRANRDGSGGDLPPFLKADNIGKVGSRAMLTLLGKARVSDGQFGEQIIADVRYNGSVYGWAIKLNSPNHRLVEDRLGVRIANWKGKKIAVTVKEYLGKGYIAVERGA